MQEFVLILIKQIIKISFSRLLLHFLFYVYKKCTVFTIDRLISHFIIKVNNILNHYLFHI
jgi:hypothetical protein